MFTLVRLYIKTAIVFFLTGLAVGAWILLVQLRGTGQNERMGLLISAHAHLLLFGFVIMLIMGVAYWMFPRPAKDDFRYSPGLAQINYWIITIGTATRALGEISLYIAQCRVARWAVVIGAMTQIISGVVFSWNIWTRVRPIGSQHREKKGERF